MRVPPEFPTEPHRIAIYFAPGPESELARAAASWFAGDAPWLSAPRRYGFHATLKAPFRLRPDKTLTDLIAELEAFTAMTPPGPALNLAPVRLDGFVALVPRDLAGAEGHAGPATLEAAIVRRFEPFRAPLGEAEIARRRAAGLSPRQDALLLEFGYPLVLDEFRFHMTLSERLAEPEGEAVLARARTHFAPALSEPVSLDRVWLFLEPSPNSAFIPARSFLLRGTRAGMDPAADIGRAGMRHA